METTGNPSTEPYLILAQELMRRIYADMSGDEIHAWLIDQLSKTASPNTDKASLLWLESLDYYDNLLEQRKIKSELPENERGDLLWAWQTWNRRIDPLEPGLLAVIAAGDGMGKTIYAETQAEAWARAGKKVAFVHFELNRSIMLDRRAARRTGINRRELRQGPFNAKLFEEWNVARNTLKGWPGEITYWHTPGWSVEQVANHLEPEIERGECDVIVIDYLEKAGASSRQMKLYGSNKWQREADDVEQIKTFAERTETPVLLLAQMSKSGKTASIDMLDRTAVRGAGEKTEKANIVVLLSRERIEDGYSETVDVRIDKNTLGPTGNFSQWMDGPHFRVFDIVTNGRDGLLATGEEAR